LPLRIPSTPADLAHPQLRSLRTRPGVREARPILAPRGQRFRPEGAAHRGARPHISGPPGRPEVGLGVVAAAQLQVTPLSIPITSLLLNCVKETGMKSGTLILAALLMGNGIVFAQSEEEIRDRIVGTWKHPVAFGERRVGCSQPQSRGFARWHKQRRQSIGPRARRRESGRCHATSSGDCARNPNESARSDDHCNGPLPEKRQYG